MARIDVERRIGLGGDDLRHVLQLLDAGGSGPHAECAPPLDVVEHADRVDVTVDLPGVAPSVIRVVYAHGTLVIAGHKLPRACPHPHVAFHLAERSFGRFARAVELAGAFDAGQATASLVEGELRVILPRIEERRGRDIAIEVTGD